MGDFYGYSPPALPSYVAPYVMDYLVGEPAPAYESTDWDNVTIDELWESIKVASDERTRALADLWRRVHSVLDLIEGNMRRHAETLAATWRSPAGEQFMREVGACLYSLSEWKEVASQNASGLDTVARNIQTTSRLMRDLYRDYVDEVDESNRRNSEIRNSNWLVQGAAFIGIGDPKPVEDIRREYNNAAKELMRPLAEVFLDVIIYNLGRGSVYQGPTNSVLAAPVGGPPPPPGTPPGAPPPALGMAPPAPPATAFAAAPPAPPGTPILTSMTAPPAQPPVVATPSTPAAPPPGPAGPPAVLPPLGAAPAARPPAPGAGTATSAPRPPAGGPNSAPARPTLGGGSPGRPAAPAGAQPARPNLPGGGRAAPPPMARPAGRTAPADGGRPAPPHPPATGRTGLPTAAGARPATPTLGGRRGTAGSPGGAASDAGGSSRLASGQRPVLGMRRRKALGALGQAKAMPNSATPRPSVPAPTPRSAPADADPGRRASLGGASATESSRAVPAARGRRRRWEVRRRPDRTDGPFQVEQARPASLDTPSPSPVEKRDPTIGPDR